MDWIASSSSESPPKLDEALKSTSIIKERMPASPSELIADAYTLRGQGHCPTASMLAESISRIRRLLGCSVTSKPTIRSRSPISARSSKPDHKSNAKTTAASKADKTTLLAGRELTKLPVSAGMFISRHRHRQADILGRVVAIDQAETLVLVVFLHVLVVFLHVLVAFLHVLVAFLHVLVAFLHVLVASLHVLVDDQ